MLLCILCCLLDADNLCDSDVLAIWYNCELVYLMFDEFDYLLRVFDPDRLLVVSMGNELSSS